MRDAFMVGLLVVAAVCLLLGGLLVPAAVLAALAGVAAIVLDYRNDL